MAFVFTAGDRLRLHAGRLVGQLHTKGVGTVTTAADVVVA